MPPAEASAGGSQNLIGRTLEGRYEITGRLGKGGMAVVYRATDQRFGRTVAIKVLRTDVASDPVATKRLLREAHAAGKLRHPHIITMHDVGTSDGMVYIVMELLQGRELSDVMDELGPLGVARSIDIARQAAGALACAHAERIIHRDIKPENMFLQAVESGEDFVKVLDFSIAKLPTNMVTAALTRAGSVFGTPHYMAPEQVEGREVSPQTDLYALGAVLYEAITGEPPYDGDSVIDILLHHVKSPVPRLEAKVPGLPVGLAELVASLLAKKESDRPASAEAVERALERLLVDARAAERPAPTAEMSVVDVGDMTFRLDPSDLLAVQRAADAAWAPPAAVAAPAMALPPRAPATAAAAHASPARPAPDVPDLPDAMPAAGIAPAPADAASARTMVGHGMADLIRREAARIEAERAAAPAARPSATVPPPTPVAANHRVPPAPPSAPPSIKVAATKVSAPTARPAAPPPPPAAPPPPPPPVASGLPSGQLERVQRLQRGHPGATNDQRATRPDPHDAAAVERATAETIAVSAADQAALQQAIARRMTASVDDATEAVAAPAPHRPGSRMGLWIGLALVVGLVGAAVAAWLVLGG